VLTGNASGWAEAAVIPVAALGGFARRVRWPHPVSRLAGRRDARPRPIGYLAALSRPEGQRPG
jgi:hypothetical protein